MFDFLVGLFPVEYRWQVAIKKISYTIAKFGVGFLAASAVGKHIDPQNLVVVEGVVGATVAGALTSLHDWLQVKYPGATWL